ncbi:MAG TPA: response regulator transcription factor [Bacteroidota bacterium]|nr:response regulator transcription factor [Bacteroidota bacterium]
MKRIRLLVIEDNRLLREGLGALIKDQPDIKLVASFGDNKKILDKLDELKPDVVLLDLGLRSQYCLRAVKLISQAHPDIKVIVMDLVPSQSDVFEFVQAGTSGFILKDATIDDFITTIRTVAGGTKILPPPLTSSLFSTIVQYAVRGILPASNGDGIRLTKREHEVMHLVAESLSNKEIASRLNLSTYTIKSHIHNILDKLSLHTRVQIANYAHTDDTYRLAANMGLEPEE